MIQEDQADFEEMKALMKLSSGSRLPVARIVSQHIKAELSIEDRERDINDAMLRFELGCIEDGMCPRCLNFGEDSGLDLFQTCPQCGWQPSALTQPGDAT